MNHCVRKAVLTAFLRWLCCVGGALHGAAFAADSSGALSLREAIAATLDANPQLGIYQVRQEVLQGEGLTAALPLPLQLSAGAEDVLGSGELGGVDRAEFSLSFSRVVELGDQRAARAGVNSRRLQLVQAERRVTELDLLAEVTRRFVAVAAAQERLELQGRAVTLAQQTVAALDPLVTAGQRPAIEQARARAALERANLAAAHGRVSLDAARIDLASMWNSQSPPFDTVRANLRDPGTAGALDALLTALDGNPDLLALAGEERLREAELREAMSARRGTAQWTAGVRHLRELGDTGFVLGASVPLGSRERAAGAIAVAEANLRGIGVQREIVLNRLRNQLSALHLRLGQAILEVNTLRDSVLPQLDAAQEQTRAAYLAGRYGYLELVGAQREYLDAELALISAAEDAHLLRAEIERLSGSPLNPENPEPSP
ncbi:MAG TPA: TolC family protein [Hyphomicrobiales bacterium]|nr:TolC family protein [Hyphomicrobiales bacterium]